MERLTSLEYLHLSKWRRMLYNVCEFFADLPKWIVGKGKGIWEKLKGIGNTVKDNAVEIWTTFIEGDWRTKVSYLVMGFSNFLHKQWLRGILFFGFEVIFILYMIFYGGYWLARLGTLGTIATIQQEVYNPLLDEYVTETLHIDNSFKILLYSIITLFFIGAFIYTWRLNIRQCTLLCEIDKSGKPVKSSKDDLHSLLDDQFHKTLLSLPVFGIVMFTVLPIIFMITVAFTSYDYLNDGYNNLFKWVGWNNFNDIFSLGSNISVAFGEILGWTLIWAFFATFTNYFLGMLVAIMINKKGIKIKKVWRTVLVLTIAVPQFISLLYISNLFEDNGVINGWLMNMGWIDSPILFWEDATLARVMVIVINIWVGIPYLMLITTGILMNIPEDLYESAKIDGANAFQQYAKITLPYMLFVTGPYLLNSFISNINNFNVIYLLTQGGPFNPAWESAGYIPGYTTILITWLYGITTGSKADYKMASVIGILIFIVVSVLSLIVFSIMPSTRREDDYS